MVGRGQLVHSEFALHFSSRDLTPAGEGGGLESDWCLESTLILIQEGIPGPLGLSLASFLVGRTLIGRQRGSTGSDHSRTDRVQFDPECARGRTPIFARMGKGRGKLASVSAPCGV